MAAQTLRVPWKQSSGRDARRALVASLRDLEVDATIVDEAEIVISELVANAVHHARPLPDGTIRVTWTVRGGVVEVEVADGGGPTIPRPAPRSLLAANGRGLRIVRGLAHEWGVLEDRAGRTVWVSLGGPSRRRSH
jgi:serine/threonine-protein kinase RsbW